METKSSKYNNESQQQKKHFSTNQYVHLPAYVRCQISDGSF